MLNESSPCCFFNLSSLPLLTMTPTFQPCWLEFPEDAHCFPSLCLCTCRWAGILDLLCLTRKLLWLKYLFSTAFPASQSKVSPQTSMATVWCPWLYSCSWQLGYNDSFSSLSSVNSDIPEEIEQVSISPTFMHNQVQNLEHISCSTNICWKDDWMMWKSSPCM